MRLIADIGRLRLWPHPTGSNVSHSPPRVYKEPSPNVRFLTGWSSLSLRESFNHTNTLKTFLQPINSKMPASGNASMVAPIPDDKVFRRYFCCCIPVRAGVIVSASFIHCGETTIKCFLVVPYSPWFPRWCWNCSSRNHEYHSAK